MKSKRLKKALGAGLALALTVGLCACGGGGSAGSGSGGGSGSGKNQGNANSALAKENVYKVEEFEVPQLLDTDEGYFDLCASGRRDGRIYAIFRVETWYGEQEISMKLLSMKEDGSDLQLTDMELPGVKNQTKYGVTESDGEEKPADSAESVPADTEEAANEGTADDCWESNYFNSMCFATDGTIYGIRVYYRDGTVNGEYVSEQHSYVCCWNTDGTLRWETEQEGLRSDAEGDEWLYVQELFTSSDGSLHILLNGDNLYLTDVSEEGVISEKKKLSEDAATVLSNYQSLMQKEDGTFLIMYYDPDNWTKTYLTTYDFMADTMSEPVQMDASFTWNGYNSMQPGLSTDIIYTNSMGVYTYNAADGHETMRMNFVNSDMNISVFTCFFELDDKSFIGLYQENYESELKGGVFTYVAPEDIPDKKVLVLAGNYVGSDLKKRVIDYNRASDEYRIVLKEYDTYNSYEDYNAGITKLNNDIITGGMPDILLTEGLPVENYIAKGWIADVNSLIEKDEELSKTEFMQNVFDAYSVDGKLYYVIPRFNVVTLVAKTSLVGDGSDWSMAKLQQVLNGMGDGAQAIGELTRDGFMSMAMQFCGSDFIDVETGKCAFDSEDFIAMMEFAATLPEEINWDELYGNDDYWSSYESQYRDNKTLLMQFYLSGFTNLSYQLNGQMGEDVTYVGFPTQNGSGSYVNALDSLVLSANSDCLDAAWEFARYYLTDEYQSELTWGLPVQKKAFMEQSQKALKRPSYTDESGNEVEYDETYWINNEEIILPPLNQQQLDQLIAFVESVDSPYYTNQDVLDIINEEMGAFYSGQKTAKDTAAVIQSRAQIFVDENR